jgi:hypothetical protein
VSGELRDFIERSLRALAVEAAPCYAQLCERLRGRRLRIGGDGAPLVLAFGAHAVVSLDAREPADVDLHVDRTTLLALVDGELTLEEALRRDGLVMRGRVADLADAFDGLTSYVRGGVRCPSFPTLLAAYRMCRPEQP